MTSVFDQLSTDFYVAGGNLMPDAHSYVVRPADDEIFSSILGGHYTYVMTSRQMGKSSLMHRTAVRLREAGIKTVLVDLTSIGSNVTPEQWYFGLLAEIGAQLSLKTEMMRLWTDLANHSPLSRLILALGDIAVARADKPISIFIDEIDFVRSLPFSTDEFFAAIRSCYNRRASEPAMRRLNFCLLGVATPADLIRNAETTPFNIGRQIELTDFTRDEALPLSAGLHADPATARGKLDRILHWTGGHPYLTQKLCLAVSQRPDADIDDVDRICDGLFLAGRARTSEDNLIFVHNTLRSAQKDRAAVIGLYRRVLISRNVANDPANPVVAQVRLAGVVRIANGRLQLRNRIYEKVFDRNWVRENMPDADLRREREAYLRGVLRTAAVSAVIVLLIAVLAGEALYQQSKAALNERVARVHALESIEAEREAQLNASAARSAERTAEAESLQAAHADQIAELREKTALQEKNLADQQTHIALVQQRNALAATVREQAALTAKNRLVNVANLQLAGQLWDSETGSARSVEDLLTATEASSPRESPLRFEWGYQWNLLHNDCSASMLVDATSGSDVPTVVSSDGFLEAIDSNMRLMRMSLASHSVTAVNLRATSPGLVSADLSPDGGEFVGVQADGSVDVRDASTLRAIAQWRIDPSSVNRARFLPGSNEIVTYCPFKNAYCWNARTGKLISQVSPLWLWPPNHASSSYAWSSGLRLGASDHLPFSEVVLSDFTGVKFQDVSFSVIPLDCGGVRSLSFSPNHSLLAIGAQNGSAVLIDTAKGSKISECSGRGSPIVVVAFSQDGKRLATGATDGIIQIWDDASLRLIATLKGHTRSVNRLAFSPNGRWIASSDVEGEVRAWNLDAMEPPDLTAGSDTADVAITRDGEILAQTDRDGQMALWDTRSRQSLPLPVYLYSADATGTQRLLLGTTFSPNNHTVATSGLALRHGQSQLFVQFWDRKTGQANARWESPPLTRDGPFSTQFSSGQGGPCVLAFSPDGMELAGGYGCNLKYVKENHEIVKVWSAGTGRELRTLHGFDSAITGISFARDGHTMAVACDDGIVRVFDIRNGSLTGKLSIGEPVSAAVYSPDSQVFALSTRGGRIEIWDARLKQLLHSLTSSASVLGLSFSPDGQTLAAGNGNRTITLWDVGTGRLMRTLAGHADQITQVAFSPDGTFLASGGDNGAVTLWKAASAVEVHAWERLKQMNTRLASVAAPLWTEQDKDAAADIRLLADVSHRRVPGYASLDPTENLFARQNPWDAPYVDSSASAANSVAPHGLLTCHIARGGKSVWSVTEMPQYSRIEPGRTYILQFRARASTAWPVRVSMENTADKDTDSGVGFQDDLTLTPRWRAYRFTFRATASDYNGNFLLFPLGGEAGDVQIADLVLVPDVRDEASSAAGTPPTIMAALESAWANSAQ